LSVGLAIHLNRRGRGSPCNRLPPFYSNKFTQRAGPREDLGSRIGGVSERKGYP
jgi:hypothetical protein